MIQLDTETKLYILGAIIALTQLPKILPSADTVKSLLARINIKQFMTSNNLVLIAVAAMLFLPSRPQTPNPLPSPDPVPVVQKDTLDDATEVYRVLMSDIWKEFAAQRSTFKDDAAALKWINERQVAAYTAAHEPINTRAAKEAAPGGNPAKFAEDFLNRSL